MSEPNHMLTVGIHLGEHNTPTEMDHLECGAEPFVIIRPCGDAGADVVFDVMLSRTSKTAAIMFLEATAKVLREMVENEDPDLEIPLPVSIQDYARGQVELFLADLETGGEA